MKRYLMNSLVFCGLAGVMSMGIATSNTAQARDQITMAGSSTVFPFATLVAEKFVRSSKFQAPVIESTGTGGGFKLFCAGVDDKTTDISNASRAIEPSEKENCAKNGVTSIVEIKFGYDGIVLAHAKGKAPVTITRKQIFLALAKQVPDGKGGFVANAAKKWSDIDPSLPNSKIVVLGPPPTSGTRDAFLELVMEKGGGQIEAIKSLPADKFKAVTHSLRDDGGYVDAGENDNLIVQKLQADHNVLGIFGYSYLEENSDKLEGALIDGQAPTYENIKDGKYPVSRPLYIYVKKAHVGIVPGVKEFLAEFTSPKAWGEDGYLSDKGLIPMSKEEQAKYAKIATDLIEMKP